MNSTATSHKKHSCKKYVHNFFWGFWTCDAPKRVLKCGRMDSSVHVHPNSETTQCSVVQHDFLVDNFRAADAILFCGNAGASVKLKHAVKLCL
jgi:hypothetical protein